MVMAFPFAGCKQGEPEIAKGPVDLSDREHCACLLIPERLGAPDVDQTGREDRPDCHRIVIAAATKPGASKPSVLKPGA